MPTPPDSDNGRVTLAVLANEIKNVSSKLDDFLARQDLADRVLVEHSVRLEAISGQLATQCQRLDGRVDTARSDLGGEIKRVEDKVKGWQAGQGGVSLILAAIAAWFGARY